MQIEQIDEDEFFTGLNERIAELAQEIADTAGQIEDNPDSSTYHIDNFFQPLQVMRKLQRLRDKARAFKENEAEDVVYVKKTANGKKPQYYYIPKSKFDRSKLADIIEQMEARGDTKPDIGYIS